METSYNHSIIIFQSLSLLRRQPPLSKRGLSQTFYLFKTPVGLVGVFEFQQMSRHASLWRERWHGVAVTEREIKAYLRLLTERKNIDTVNQNDIFIFTTLSKKYFLLSNRAFRPFYFADLHKWFQHISTRNVTFFV